MLTVRGDHSINYQTLLATTIDPPSFPDCRRPCPSVLKLRESKSYITNSQVAHWWEVYNRHNPSPLCTSLPHQQTHWWLLLNKYITEKENQKDGT